MLSWCACCHKQQEQSEEVFNLRNISMYEDEAAPALSKKKNPTSNGVMFNRYIRQTALFLNASQKLVKTDACIISINEVMRKKNKISVSSVLSLRPFTRSKHQPLRIAHKCVTTVNSNKLLLGRKCSCCVFYSTKHKSQWRSGMPKGENGLTLCGNICFCVAVAHQKMLIRTM